MQNDAALDLHGEQPDGKHPVHGLPASRKSVCQDVIQRSAALQTFFQNAGLGFQLLVAHFSVFVFQPKDLVHQGLDAFQFPFAVVAKQLC